MITALLLRQIGMKFDTGMNLDVFYTMATKNCNITTVQ